MEMVLELELELLASRELEELRENHLEGFVRNWAKPEDGEWERGKLRRAGPFWPEGSWGLNVLGDGTARRGAMLGVQGGRVETFDRPRLATQVVQGNSYLIGISAPVPVGPHWDWDPRQLAMVVSPTHERWKQEPKAAGDKRSNCWNSRIDLFENIDQIYLN